MAELDETLKEPSRLEGRIKELSDKVELTSKEKDEKERLLKEQEAKSAVLEKERDFYAQFSDVVSEKPQAKEYKQDILAKVQQGYSVQDAMVAVLHSAGKLETKPEPVNPAGGSSPTNPPEGGTKTVAQMSRDEKRAALLEAEKRGDIGIQ